MELQNVNVGKKIVVVLMIIALLSLSVQTSVSAAQTTSYNPNYTEQNETAPEAVAAAPVVVFIAGIAIGYLVDGVIIYYTGHRAAELTAKGIKKVKAYVKKHPKVKKVYYNKKTGKVGSGTGGGGGGTW